MTTTTKNAKTTATDTTNEAIQDALKFYEEALKSGIQLQEDSLKLWKDVLDQVSSPDDLKNKLEELVHNVLPQNKKCMEDVVSLFQKNSAQCTDLFSKALNVYQAGSITEGQTRLQDLVETSLSALHSNVNSLVETNTQVMKSWDSIFARK
ncbi:hypothetical protein VDG1235_4633 [Verrucomicrobiia bacterium DG1235]|nr:hypothetical protein VDG1235_4633 [Verrucomicrobiae bacterium DG1235]